MLKRRNELPNFLKVDITVDCEKLLKCFEHIDADGDGEISLSDMRAFLGEECDENDVLKIFD